MPGFVLPREPVKIRPPWFAGLLLFGVAHAFLYRSASPAWREGRAHRTHRLGGWIFVLSYLFWEFFTPFIQFGEPLPLIGLELAFWWVTALSEAVAIVFLYER